MVNLKNSAWKHPTKSWKKYKHLKRILLQPYQSEKVFCLFFNERFYFIYLFFKNFFLLPLFRASTSAINFIVDLFLKGMGKTEEKGKWYFQSPRENSNPITQEEVPNWEQSEVIKHQRIKRRKIRELIDVSIYHLILQHIRRTFNIKIFQCQHHRVQSTRIMSWEISTEVWSHHLWILEGLHWAVILQIPL